MRATCAVFAYSKEVVSGLVSDLVSGSAIVQTLSVRTTDASKTVRVSLAASVEVTGIAQNLSADPQVTTTPDVLNVSISDDALTVAVNGTGDLIVHARSSSVYADAASFLALGGVFSRDLDRNTSMCKTYDVPAYTGRAGSLVEQMGDVPVASTSGAPNQALGAALSAVTISVLLFLH